MDQEENQAPNGLSFMDLSYFWSSFFLSPYLATFLCPRWKCFPLPCILWLFPILCQRPFPILCETMINILAPWSYFCPLDLHPSLRDPFYFLEQPVLSLKFLSELCVNNKYFKTNDYSSNEEYCRGILSYIIYAAKGTEFFLLSQFFKTFYLL